MVSVHRLKRAKLNQKQVQIVQKAAINNMYTIPAQYADVMYTTTIDAPQGGSMNIRLTFAETKQGIGEHSPVTAVMVPLHTYLQMYDFMTRHLQLLREAKKIP